MFYPQEFVTRVKEAYPNWLEMHQKLDAGDEEVGKFLRNTIISLTELINASSSSKEVRLQILNEAEEKSKEIVELYFEWLRLRETNK